MGRQVVSKAATGAAKEAGYRIWAVPGRSLGAAACPNTANPASDVSLRQ